MGVQKRGLPGFLRLETPRNVDWFDAVVGYLAVGPAASFVWRLFDEKIRAGPSMLSPYVSHACDAIIPLFWYVVLRRRFPIGKIRWNQLRAWVPFWIVTIFVISASIGAAVLLGLRAQLSQTIDLSLDGSLFELIAPGIGEEFLWRGLIQSGLNETLNVRLRILKFDIGLGTLITALCFGAAHMGNVTYQPLQITCLQAASAFIGGLVLGIGYERTRNLWGAIVCHTVADVTSFAWIALLAR